VLRTICKRCFDICSYADEPVYYESEFRTNPDLIGHVEYPGTWEDFYKFATGSPDVFLIKTHQLPVDCQPFIYIVRDGRKSIRSYQRFMRNFNQKDVSLAQLILGVDAYGGWSAHYEKWNHRDVEPRLTLKFDELIHLTDDTVARIADFVKYGKTPMPWQNPVDHLKTIEPNFFNSPKTADAIPEFWNPSHEYLFSVIHGRLMRELKFDPTPFEPENRLECPDHMKQMIQHMVGIVNELVKEKRMLQETCGERLALIHKLNDVCEERLKLIEKLNSAIHQV
jgi:hypothetical protein